MPMTIQTNQAPLLIVVCGPTASGKTSLAVKLAHHFNTVVLSADSRQFYKEMRIGTAVPTPEEREGVEHYFVQHLSVHQPYNASAYADEALLLLHQLFLSRRVVILAGGSGLYINMLCHGMDPMPDPEPEIRKLIDETFSKQGLEALQAWIARLDPETHQRIDLNNPKRLQRAIEVCLITGKPYSQQRTAVRQPRFFNILKFGMNRPRPELFERIARRTDAMLAEGLLEEARGLIPCRNLNSLQTVGYRELFDHFDGKISLEQAITDIKTNTRRYAKRQITWFQRDEEIHWEHPDNLQTLISKAEELL